MTEVIENPQTTVHSSVHAPGEREPNRLNRALAWVGIAAGSLFIVGSIFFSGYVLGQHSDGGSEGRPHHMMLRPPPPPEGPAAVPPSR